MSTQRTLAINGERTSGAQVRSENGKHTVANAEERGRREKEGQRFFSSSVLLQPLRLSLCIALCICVCVSVFVSHGRKRRMIAFVEDCVCVCVCVAPCLAVASEHTDTHNTSLFLLWSELSIEGEKERLGD